MSKVFSRRISIFGDHIDNYIETPRDRKTEFKPLRRQLQQLNGEFKRFLGRSFTPKTVRKHFGVIELFIDYLEWDTDESELKTAIKKFFRFLAEKKNIVNEPVLKSFKR